MAFRFETAGERWKWFKRAVDEFDTMGFYDSDEIGNSLNEIYNQNANGTKATFARIHNAILDIGAAGDEISKVSDEEIFQKFNNFNIIVRDNFAFIAQELENWEPEPIDLPDDALALGASPEDMKDFFVNDAKNFHLAFERIVRFYEEDPEQIFYTSEALGQAHNDAQLFAEMLEGYYRLFMRWGPNAI